MSVRSFYQPLHSVEAVRAIDTTAIEKLGIPTLVLMETAGEKSAELIKSLHLDSARAG